MKLFKNKDLSKKIDKNRIPKHIAFILDGNGRWAQKRGLPRTAGHKAGIKAVRETVLNALEMGIGYISLYAFSTENWNRPQEELDYIFNQLKEYVDSDLSEYVEKGIKLVTSGDITKFPKDIYEAMKRGVEETKNCAKLVVNLCVNYGGRDDIITAVNKIIKAGVKKVTEKEFSNYLYTAGMPDPDLIVRTSGERRLSNFLMYQGAYSEFYFPKIYWPEFNKKQLQLAIIEFQGRDRRFGKIKKK